MSFKRPVLCAVMWAGIATTAGADESRHGNFGSETVKVGAVDRIYRLVVPKTVDLTKPVPLVLAFHGIFIDSKDVMPAYSKLNETAETHKFILVYPNAVEGSWGLMPDKVKSDLAFFDALLAKLTGVYKIDPDRVYVLGMSNGGYLAHLIGKERSRTVAAVASHSGPLGLQTLLGVNAERKFPVLIIHGEQDKLLPVAWARDNRDKYKKEGHEVKYVEPPGLGHMWATEIGVNEIIWSFFNDHPRRSP
ncbi:MAG: phospholipase/Carboxylesterase [Planctomycetota bacterium]|nr:phospholipase/Carboxylesterase [Planctomycetota bacterium]